MYRNRDQEVNQSKTLLCTVLLFLVLNLPRLVLFHMELRRIQGFSLCKVTQDHTLQFHPGSGIRFFPYRIQGFSLPCKVAQDYTLQYLAGSRILDPVFSIPDPGLLPLQGSAGSFLFINSIADPGCLSRIQG
jgi:hypothetical protein